MGKRKFLESSDDSSSQDNYSDDSFHDEDNEIDISSSLTSKKKKLAHADEDEELGAFLQESIVKRNMKEGTDLLKKTRGKTKLTKGEVGGGSFQSMGLHPSLLRSLNLKGYRIPTPIQRLSIPALLANPPQDLVGMARTGSGKSLAYMIPLIQRLGGRHSVTFGARALILLPTRELALQILKVGKELVRGWNHDKGEHFGDSQDVEYARGTRNLRWSLIVGGEGMDEQFETITNNPDVIIATPGRLLHLIVEMNLDLKSVQYVVFDEADRLFEMGFETALNEILQRLPASRQTLLFSATLPKSLVEFAKAGLENPKLVRLDAESKISSDLKMAFFSVKQVEKEACLLMLLRDIIRVPLAQNFSKPSDADKSDRTGKKNQRKEQATLAHQTLVFAATKHHVEYLTALLTTAGYAVSHIYGSLDQAARTYQMEQFRRGQTSILVVTDVAARGIDIPVLENVVNFDFPQGARVFVHRVGRTARAGRPGWAWSFVTNNELPYLLDLQLFLGRPLKCTVDGDGEQIYTESLIIGPFERGKIDEDVEYIRSLNDVNHSLPSMRAVMTRGHTMYERSKGKATPASYQRAKEMVKDPKWILAGSDRGMHPVLLKGAGAAQRLSNEQDRQSLLRAVNAFTPPETVFEINSKGRNTNSTAQLMKQRRKALEKSAQRSQLLMSVGEGDEGDMAGGSNFGKETEMADEVDIAAVFDNTDKMSGFRDSEFYMSHYQRNASDEKGYSLTDGASFVEQARGAVFDLVGDEALAERKRRTLNWDKQKKKFVKGNGTGSDNIKLVKTESGTKLPATYRSGRFEEWKAKNRSVLPRVGEIESGTPNGVSDARRYKHKRVTTESKPLDKLHNDYNRKLRKAKMREAGNVSEETPKPKGRMKSTGRYGGRSVGKVKSELKSATEIRKSRKMMEQRKAKNARSSHKKR